MPTYRIDLSYDGSGFRGYAAQEGLRTVQGELDSALATLFKCSVDSTVAGRTDAGVHARHQVVSFTADTDMPTDRVVRSLNGMLGPEIAVLDLKLVASDFSARFSARWRQYRYLIGTAAPDPMRRHEIWQVGRQLDHAAMAAASQLVVGEHDFSSFCRAVEGRSNTRLVTESRWEVEGPLLIFWITANAFCHQMVRSLVGHFYDVGRGFSSSEGTTDVIAARDRSAVATVAPPHGLSLWEVGY